MIKYEASIAADSDPTNRSEVRKPEQIKKDEAKAIAALRKSYRDDIQVVIKENFESYSKRFEMGLDDLNKDLSKKIKHEGDRVIKYLQGGPHSRISDKVSGTLLFNVAANSFSTDALSYLERSGQLTVSLISCIIIVTISRRGGRVVRKHGLWCWPYATTSSSASSAANCPLSRMWSRSLLLKMRTKTMTMILRAT
jgi:hypothetical protein